MPKTINMTEHLAHIGDRVQRVKDSGIYETQADIDRERLYDMLKASRSFDLLLAVLEPEEEGDHDFYSEHKRTV